MDKNMVTKTSLDGLSLDKVSIWKQKHTKLGGN